jgi:hypothetical protein
MVKAGKMMAMHPSTILLSSAMEMEELSAGTDEDDMHLLIGPAPKIAPAPRFKSIKAATKLTASYLFMVYRGVPTIRHI